MTETQKRQRLTEEELHEAYGAIRLCHPKIPRVYADHMQAREDRKALVQLLRDGSRYDSETGSRCWCQSGQFPCWNRDATEVYCARAMTLLAEVAPR